MNTSDNRQEFVSYKPDELFGPKEHFSSWNQFDKWRIVPYQTESFEGNLLSCNNGIPPDITYDPKLTGWYKIYLLAPGNSVLLMKLTSDPAYLGVAAASKRMDTMEEFLWRCADMTGQSISINRLLLDGTDPKHSMLGGLRLVPMTQEEVAQWKYEETRTDTKRIYATDDMHNRLFYMNHLTQADWLPSVLNYCHSDVEWISLEQIRNFVTRRLVTDNIDEFSFPRPGDKLVQENFPKFNYQKVLEDCVKVGHENGFKMSLSLRMGAWGMGFPFDQCYFDSDFSQNHPEFKTVDRNGDPICAMSYAYPEVQDFMVSELVNMAETGCDAVTLIGHRGIPYVLFEKPVADRFYEMYGEYPYELPLDEPRLHKLHCQIMTEFMRKARKALDDRFGKNKVEIHVRTSYSVFDSDYISLDVESWAREGLISAVITYPLRTYEKLEGDIWKDEEHTRIDLDKYSHYVHTAHDVIRHFGDFKDSPAYVNYRGKLCGPASPKERVERWMVLEKEYGVKVYFDIMPRYLTNEQYKSRALELYEYGAERVSMWDTYGSRVMPKAMWSTAGRLGHKEELSEMDVGEGVDYRIYKICQLAGYDISRYAPCWGG